VNRSRPGVVPVGGFSPIGAMGRRDGRVVPFPVELLVQQPHLVEFRFGRFLPR